MTYHKNDICIVGTGCVLPDAPNPEKYWENILNGHCSLRPIPPSRWRKELYYSPDTNEKDKTCSHLGAVIEEETLISIRKSLDLEEREYTRLDVITLEAARQALSGLPMEDLRGKKSSIVLGCMGPDDDASLYLFLDEEKSIEKYIDQHCSGEREELRDSLRDYFDDLKRSKNTRRRALLPIHAARLMEEKLGFTAERCLVDAACASSLAAVDVSMKKLASHETDIAIAGGMETSLELNRNLLFWGL